MPCSPIHASVSGAGPVAAQADLDEVAPGHRARLDEPAHRRAVGAQVAPRRVRGIGVGIEVDDPQAARSDGACHCRGRRKRDRVVAAEDDRERAGGQHVGDLALDHGMAALDVHRRDRRVAGVDHVEPLVRLDPELERVDRSGVVARLADGPRPESGPGSMAHRVVERGSDDRDVRAALGERGGIGDPWQLLEAGQARRSWGGRTRRRRCRDRRPEGPRRSCRWRGGVRRSWRVGAHLRRVARAPSRCGAGPFGARS